MTSVGRRWIVVLAASYFFYSYWNVSYALLIALSTGINFSAGWLIARREKGQSTVLVLLAVIFNVLLLGVFKYYGFFRENLSLLGLQIPGWSFLLPVGISFYTFQGLAYVLDVARGTVRAERNPARFALFITFFPQLVAGPIERSSHLIPALRTIHTSWENLSIGVKLIVWGLFKKVVVADRISPFVDRVYQDPQLYDGPILLAATYGFALQIYADFSGYSDIAIGSAALLGVNLRENFSRPYFAISVREFWTRWHISLSSWFRDYVYFAMGGSRGSSTRWILAVLGTFTLSGLWHGASWTFVVWGVYHAFLYLAEGSVRTCTTLRLPRVIRVIVTFHLVLFGWIVFRAGSIQDVVLVVDGIVRFALAPLEILDVLTLKRAFLKVGIRREDLFLTCLFALVVVFREATQELNLLKRIAFCRRPIVTYAFYDALVIVILLFGSYGANPFIYFQF
jgi:D-alanyl-lipoteichoic acid acyltransferase DltB (MBOAT superfamily)